MSLALIRPLQSPGRAWWEWETEGGVLFLSGSSIFLTDTPIDVRRGRACRFHSFLLALRSPRPALSSFSKMLFRQPSSRLVRTFIYIFLLFTTNTSHARVRHSGITYSVDKTATGSGNALSTSNSKLAVPPLLKRTCHAFCTPSHVESTCSKLIQTETDKLLGMLFTYFNPLAASPTLRTQLCSKRPDPHAHTCMHKQGATASTPASFVTS